MGGNRGRDRKYVILEKEERKASKQIFFESLSEVFMG